MKRFVTLLLFVFVLAASSQAFAALSDTRADIEKKYDGYRMVVDTDNQLWTREEWESKGITRAKAGGYMYYFDRAGMALQMEVNYYNGDKPDSRVQAQRITPVGVMKIKDLKTYLPELYELVTGPRAAAFTTDRPVTRNFREDKSPLTVGVVVKEPVPGQTSWYTLVSFNVKDEGRLLKDAKFLSSDLYIQEISIERVHRIDLDDPTAVPYYWQYMKKNIFKL